MRSAARRSIRIVPTSAAVLIMFLVIVGFTYEQLGRNRDALHRFRIGRAVDIGGRTLNIDCSGEGPPTVILLPTRYEETENAQACAATQNGYINRRGGSGNPEIDDAARHVTNLGNMPIVVLTGGQYWKPDDDPVAAQQISEFHETWVHELQPALAHLSTQGRQIILPNSDHGIPDQAPDAVIDAIRSIVDQNRRHVE
jgi:hypothetical protein